MTYSIHKTEASGLSRIVWPDSDNMDADFVSDIIDFGHSRVAASIHFKWEGNDQADAQIAIEASDFLDPDDSTESEKWFDEVELPCGETRITLNASGAGPSSRKTQLINLGTVGYRYARIAYYKGSNTTGMLRAIALGKSDV